MRVDHEKKSNGVRVYHKRKSDEVKDDHKKKSVGLEKKDTMNQVRWRVGVREIAAEVNPATPVYGDKPRSKLD